MLKFKSISLKGFKSFKQPQTFFFPERNGFFFVEGRNEVEPELGANGAGKSTLFDALYYVFYGETPRGVKAGNVHTWYDECSTIVAVNFELDAVDYTLSRSWNPNSLVLNERIVSQDEIDKLIRLSSTAFCNSILIPQFEPLFFDWTPGDKLKLFSTVMDLDGWLIHSESATRLRDKFKLDLDSFQKQQYAKAGELIGLRESLGQLIELAEQWESKNKVDIDMCSGSIDEANRRKTDFEFKLTDAYNSLVLKREYVGALSLKVKVLKQNRVDELIRYNEIANSGSVIVSDINQKQQELKKFEAVTDNPRCPYCSQKVNKAHIEREVRRIIVELETLNTQLECWQLETEGHKQNSVLVELETTTELLIQEQKNEAELSTIYTLLESELVRVDKELLSLRSTLAKLSKDENQILKQIELGIQNKEKLQQSIQQILSRITTTTKRLAEAEYWIKGFKTIRLFLIDSALKQLEVETNELLVELGLTGWGVKLDVEKENKKGTFSKGFVVLIKSPYNSDLVPWESWSGGESQRLRLAGTMALSNLILEQKGLKSNIMLFDEPSVHLSTQGVDDLLECLHQKSTDKQIWLVEHHSLTYPFDGRMTVVKTEDGSTIED